MKVHFFHVALRTINYCITITPIKRLRECKSEGCTCVRTPPVPWIGVKWKYSHLKMELNVKLQLYLH